MQFDNDITYQYQYRNQRSNHCFWYVRTMQYAIKYIVELNDHKGKYLKSKHERIINHSSISYSAFSVHTTSFLMDMLWNAFYVYKTREGKMGEINERSVFSSVWICYTKEIQRRSQIDFTHTTNGSYHMLID